MKYVRLLLVLFSIALVGCTPQATETPDEATDVAEQSPLNGAWETVGMSGTNADGDDWKLEHVQPSLYVFQDGYYSEMLVQGNEARPLMADDATRESLTDEEIRSMFMTFIANSGTYEVEGSSVTTRPMVALWPNFMEGGFYTFTYRMEGEWLYLSGERDIYGGAYTQKLRRLGSGGGG